MGTVVETITTHLNTWAMVVYDVTPSLPFPFECWVKATEFEVLSIQRARTFLRMLWARLRGAVAGLGVIRRVQRRFKERFYALNGPFHQRRALFYQLRDVVGSRSAQPWNFASQTCGANPRTLE